MVSESSTTNPQEISGVIFRVNQLGAATERLFGRVYSNLTRKSKKRERERRRVQLQDKLNKAQRISQANRRLKKKLNQRDHEVERLRGILGAIDEGIIMQDLEGRIVFINRAAYKMVGNHKNVWSSEVGTLFDQYKHITTANSEIEPLGEPASVQVNNRILGAQLAAVANDNGDRLGTMIVLRDVTRDALADRLKDQFVTAISHELKTPMTVIKGMSEVMMGQPKDAPPNRRLLETLSRNVDILDRMVVELLDVSEMGAGTFSIRQDELALEPLILSVVKGATPEVKKNKLEIIFMIRDRDALQFNGDEQHLRWALGHLLANSTGYTPAGGRVMVRAQVNNDDPNLMNIEFKDTGVGIADKDLPHIFERFYRGDPRDEDGRLVDPRGLGQGLFIARTIAEAHGGYLSVDTELGEGTTFTLSLPRNLN